MRIAVVTTSYPQRAGDPSGHFVQSEARTFAAEGHDVWVIAPGEREGLEPGSPHVRWLPAGNAFGWPGVVARVRERPWRSLEVLAYLAAARRALREHGPFDRVVAHWLVPCGWPLALTAPRECALEVVAHGSDVRLLAKAPRLARLLLRALIARSARLRCVSQELADVLCRLEPRAAAIVHVEACALALPSDLDRRRAREHLHAGEAPLVLVIGRLIPEKRIEVALRSARLLGTARCVVVGDGPARAALERQFPTVEFIGAVPRDQCLQWIAAAHLVLSASALEGAPTVVREARGLGTPVTARAAGDLGLWALGDDGLWVLDDGGAAVAQHLAPPWFD